jgi:hypothetical protein
MSHSVALSVYLSYSKNMSLYDKIIVQRVNNNFVVNHYDAETKKTYTLTLSNTSLGEYVKTLCQLFVSDTDAFGDIQFNFHGFPSFMAKQKTFAKNINLCSTLVTAANIVSESFFADSPEDVYCDDMPPLVPINQSYIGRAPSSDEWERHY